MYNEKYTLDLVDTKGINHEGLDLLNKLNMHMEYGAKDPEGSVMSYGNICNCDDGWLCEHRLQVIADWIKENQK